MIYKDDQGIIASINNEFGDKIMESMQDPGKLQRGGISLVLVNAQVQVEVDPDIGITRKP